MKLGLAFMLVLGLALAGAGCYGTMEPLGGGGGDDTTGGDDDTSGGGGAEATFNSDVKPLVGGCAGCHGGAAPVSTGFLGAAGESGYYAALKSSTVVSLAAPASSVLITHTHVAAGYPELDATGKSKVQAWLEAEAAP
jgi:hypothetical protein